jgi:hypothetical protein
LQCWNDANHCVRMCKIQSNKTYLVILNTTADDYGSISEEFKAIQDFPINYWNGSKAETAKYGEYNCQIDHNYIVPCINFKDHFGAEVFNVILEFFSNHDDLDENDFLGHNRFFIPIPATKDPFVVNSLWNGKEKYKILGTLCSDKRIQTKLLVFEYQNIPYGIAYTLDVDEYTPRLKENIVHFNPCLFKRNVKYKDGFVHYNDLTIQSIIGRDYEGNTYRLEPTNIVFINDGISSLF